MHHKAKISNSSIRGKPYSSSLIPKKCIAWCTRIEILIFQSPKKHMDLKFLQFLFLFTVRKSEIRICFKLTLRPQSGKNWFWSGRIQKIEFLSFLAFKICSTATHPFSKFSTSTKSIYPYTKVGQFFRIWNYSMW